MGTKRYYTCYDKIFQEDFIIKYLNLKGMRSYHLMSASWDQTIKIWNLNAGGLTALTSLNGHESIVYSGSWNPKMSGKNDLNLVKKIIALNYESKLKGVLLSTSADKTFRVWDVNSSSLNSSSIFKSDRRNSDILCCDWNKFDPNIFCLGYASGN